jgi:hypothetical protein
MIAIEPFVLADRDVVEPRAVLEVRNRHARGPVVCVVAAHAVAIARVDGRAVPPSGRDSQLARGGSTGRRGDDGDEQEETLIRIMELLYRGT